MRNIILVVDDGKENIDSLRGILEDKYDIRVALNGETALAILRNTKPDLILLDVMMPGISGFEVMEIMRANPELESIPVIFITGDADSYSEAKGLTLGAVDYVTKPYDPTIVSIKVHNAIINKMYRDSLEKLVEERTAEVVRTQAAIIMGMSLLAEGRDKGTGDHIMRIKLYTELLAKKILDDYPGYLTEQDARHIIDMSPMHDIGKVQVPDAVLNKAGKLTDEEFEVMKSHTILGAEVLQKTEDIMKSSSASMRIAIEIAKSHHEKYDGTGYPHRLAGEDIPLSARIVSIADVYDALTTMRPYKDAFSHEQARDIILNGDGRTEPGHFDPVVLEAFRDLSKEFIEVYSDYAVEEDSE